MNMHRSDSCFLAILAAVALTFSGCNGSSSSGGPAGMLNLGIADTPVDSATSVMITVTAVEVAPAGVEEDGNNGDDSGEGMSMGMGGMSAVDMGDDDSGSSGDDNGVPTCSKCVNFTFATPLQIDLMQQQGGSSASLLSGVNLAAGRYAWIRLLLDPTKATITLTDGSVHPLTLRSEDETGLKLVDGFTVGAGGVVDFTVDFDLRRSVVLANGSYILKPVLRLVNMLDVGRISGAVSNTVTFGTVAISDPSCGPAAYVYAGSGVTPTPINSTSSAPAVASEPVKLDSDTGAYDYRVPFLAPGSYTVSVACGSLDTPTTASGMVFLTPKNATVTSDTTTEVDFP
jgi:hypothetical protein